MSIKTAGRGVVLLALILGIALGYGIAQIFSLIVAQAPSSHQSIVNSMEIIDTSAQFRLTPKLVDSGQREWGKGLTILSVFSERKEYAQSTWIWQRYGDTEIAMTIWGPDDSGKVFMIEIARLGADPFIVKINGITKLTIDTATKSPEVGYYCLEVSL